MKTCDTYILYVLGVHLLIQHAVQVISEDVYMYDVFTCLSTQNAVQVVGNLSTRTMCLLVYWSGMQCKWSVIHTHV